MCFYANEILGGISRSTLAKYQKLPYTKLSRDTLERIIPSHYPPIDLFERVYDTPEELAIAFEIKAMTNDHLLDEAGDLQFVAPEDRLVGPGSSPVMTTPPAKLLPLRVVLTNLTDFSTTQFAARVTSALPHSGLLLYVLPCKART